MVWCTSSPNSGHPFEDTDHAWPILGQEFPGLLDHLLVLKPTDEHSGHDHSKYGKEQIVVFPKCIRVVNIWKRRLDQNIDKTSPKMVLLTNSNVRVSSEQLRVPNGLKKTGLQNFYSSALRLAKLLKERQQRLVK